MITAVSASRAIATSARRILRLTGLLLLGLVLVGMSGWGVLALRYWDHASPTLRNALIVVWALASLALIVGFALRRWRWRSFAAFMALFAVLLTAWSTIEPSNGREWEPENAVLAYATIDGDRITLHNIRNFNYRTDTDGDRADGSTAADVGGDAVQVSIRYRIDTITYVSCLQS